MTTSLYPRRLSVKDPRFRKKENLEWVDAERPKTRADCENGLRPCPWAMCKHHLFLEVNPNTGTITFNHPNKEIWELEETCSLDKSDDEQTLKTIGKLLNISRERARQIESLGYRVLKLNSKLRELTVEE